MDLLYASSNYVNDEIGSELKKTLVIYKICL